jgi:ankyrin repeat protein
MKAKSLLLSAAVLAAVTHLVLAATNDLTSALQKGLFEEEANHNLEAAAQAYQAVSAQFDKDRKLAATAIFRLGEVYRKQGKTNEATAQYERIVREFSDQSTLVTLSRQNLAGLGDVAQTRAGVAANTATVDNLQSQYALLKAQLEQARKETNFLTIAKLLDDEELRGLVHSATYVIRTPEDQQKVFEAAAARALDYAEKRLSILQSAIAQAGAGQFLTTADKETSPTTDDEEKEIRRIQAMIQNSPDLINAPSGDPTLTPLCRAASKGQLRVAKFLLDGGAPIDGRSNDSTPLHYAVSAGHRAMTELLLQRGADTSARNSFGQTALHVAAQNGFQAVAEALIAGKADVNSMTSKQETPLHAAAGRGHVDLVKFLISKGAKLDVKSESGSTPVMRAATSGHSETLTVLLAAKANPNLEDKEGRTALSYAAGNGHFESVKTLLAAKADPNASRYNLPLHMAIHAKSPAIVEALLRADADANRVAAITYKERNGTMTAFDCNPLYLAVYEINPEAVKLLLQFKAEPNGISSSKEPVIFRAIGNISILKALLEAGADANAKDLEGASVLIRAASNEDAVKLLLDHSAQVDARDKSQATALLWAANFRNVKSAELLLAAKADVNARGSYGSTPLHRAVYAGQRKLVELLLVNRADPNIRENGGMTPLDYTKPRPGTGIPATTSFAQPGGEPPAKPEELAALLREHGALDDLPDFTAIRITRQGWERPYVVFRAHTNGWNRFTLLETVMNFYGRSTVIMGNVSRAPVDWMPFPDFARLIIRRPNRAAGGREQEFRVSLLNSNNVVDCANDVPLEFGDVIEIPERVHSLSDTPNDPVRSMETELSLALRGAANASAASVPIAWFSNKCRVAYAGANRG